MSADEHPFGVRERQGGRGAWDAQSGVVVRKADHERADRFVMAMGDDAPEAPFAVGGWSPPLFGVSEARRETYAAKGEPAYGVYTRRLFAPLLAEMASHELQSSPPPATGTTVPSRWR